jgi:AmmeMemoRadiSam system protein B
MNSKVRASIVDDIFYPADPALLRNTVESLLRSAGEHGGAAGQLVVPHAAYSLVGTLLAAAFARAASRPFERVLVLAGAHRPLGASVVLTESGEFDCPLGPVAIDYGVNELLLDCCTSATSSDIPHLEEHGIEVVVPFVRVLFPEATLCPVLLGSRAFAATRALASAISHLDAESTLLVISSNAACTQSPADASAHAERFLDALRRRDADALRDQTLDGAMSACGAVAVATLFALPHSSPSMRLLGRSRASDEPGNAVEYASISFEEEDPHAAGTR